MSQFNRFCKVISPYAWLAGSLLYTFILGGYFIDYMRGREVTIDRLIAALISAVIYIYMLVRNFSQEQS